MPSELAKSIQKALVNFVKLQTCDDQNLKIDVLRSIRDEAEKMMERQTICDTFDADPLKFFEDDDDNLMKTQVDRLLRQMKVVSSSRNDTKSYSSIETVVEIQRDAMMKNVNESVRITFSFERNQIIRAQKPGNVNCDNESKNDEENSHDNVAANDRKRKRLNDFQLNDDRCINETFGTDVTYRIDLSKDHLKKDRLIDIYVQAPGICPSIKKAVALEEHVLGGDEENMFDEFDENGNLMNNSKEKADSETDQERKSDDCSNDAYSNDNDDIDRYAAYVDPHVMQNFLQWTGLDFDVQNTLFFLMTFPYYEHEWDIFGFLLSCVFGGESDEESMETVHDSD